MDESLKTIRLLHQVIVVLSVTLLAFGLSSDERPKIYAAIQELRQLRDLQPKNFYAWVAAKTIRTDQDTKSHYQPLADVFGATFASDFQFQPSFYAEWPSAAASLKEWDKFLTEGSLVETYEASIDKWVLGKRQLLPELRDQVRRNNFPTGLTLTKVIGQAPSDNHWNFRASDAGNLFGQRVFARPLSRADWSFLVYYNGKQQGGASFDGGGGVYQSPVTSNWAAQWLRADTKLRELLGSNDTVVLPQTKYYWLELEQENIPDALALLNKKRQLAPHSVTVSGITVDTILLVWLGPVVILAFLSYFAAHLQHLETSADAQIEAILQFPWIGFFKNKTSYVLLWATVFALPCLAAVLVIVRTFDGSQWVSYVGTAAALAIVLTQVRIHRLLSRLRRAGYSGS